MNPIAKPSWEIPAFLGAALLLAIYLVLSQGAGSDWMLDALTGLVAAIAMIAVCIQLDHATLDRRVRRLWQVAVAVLILMCLAEFSEAAIDRFGEVIGVGNYDDYLILAAAPILLASAGRFDARATYARWVICLAFLIQLVPMLGWPYPVESHATATPALWDLTNFVSVSLYLVSMFLMAFASAHPRLRASARSEGRAPELAAARGSEVDPAGVGAAHGSGARFLRKCKSKVRLARYYWTWRLRHPLAPYEYYYVHRVKARIDAGREHPAIGPAARPLRSEAELLEFLQRHGLRSGDLTIDYGCGSLRLAPPLIEFLEPGKYWGMDLVEDFLELGRAHLAPALADAKHPRLDVISDEVIRQARIERPRFIISWHVCSKVPANRLDAYIGNIVGMMTVGATALVHFPEASELRKQTGLAWARPRSQVAAAIARANPNVVCEFAPVTAGEVDGIRQTYAILTYSL